MMDTLRPDPVRNPYLASGQDSEGQHTDSPGNATVGGRIRTAQVVTIALVMGATTMAAVLVFVTFFSGANDIRDAAPGNPAGGGVDVILVIACFVSFSAFVASLIVPRFIRAAAINQFRGREDKTELPLTGEESLTPPLADLIGRYATATLVGQAILEGAANINLVFMVINANPLHLVIAAVMVAGVLAYWPAVGRFESWIRQARA